MVEVINMMYISKGIVKEGSTEQRLTVCYGGAEYVLTGKEAKSWLDGRYGEGRAEGLFPLGLRSRA